ncbi:MAG: Arginine-tRNA ligase [Berkelbacteria bacterium GW2011_GWB1_38_5]|uniref:Arginine--tRNA ligase n=1 Tax=Berkelbacteria bacterium GW2011_GWB1_38_5 TaxID=1618336 RepID=A0A0G0N9U6_9BACT|nr:MAG: Arginine-tRNA ligase [Berkelbacteria bacterium GW2011_GWB1_38_5]
MNEIKEIIQKAIREAYPDIEMPDFVVTDAPEKFGDFSTNVAMILGKRLGESPGEIANKIAKIVEQTKDNQKVEKVEVVKPGFINFKMQIPYWTEKISEILETDNKYGQNNFGQNRKVDVEFISANPTGPLTVGNARGGVIGDCIASVLEKSGWQVTREYYFNDAGGQIDILGHSILADDKAEYKGDYIEELRGQIETKDYKEAGKLAAKILIEKIKKTAEEMGIKFDVFFAEGKDLRDKNKVKETIEWLKSKDLIYEKDGAVWFLSTKFGDDKDRVLIKTSGEPTYFGVDASYHRNKFQERNFDRVIDIWGADHHGDVSRIKGFVKALGYEDKFEIVLHQFVRIVVSGKEVRMSKRTGNFIAVEDLLKEVGKDAYRFFMLAYDLNSHMTFDLNLAKEQSQKNPVYYVQYAYARIASILAKIKNQNAKIISNDQITKLLKEPEEIALIKQLAKLPNLVEEIGQSYQIQKLPFYATELANAFHGFYEKCPVLQAEAEVKLARLQLLKATQIVLKNTLDIMGISAPEKM